MRNLFLFMVPALSEVVFLSAVIQKVIRLNATLLCLMWHRDENALKMVEVAVRFMTHQQRHFILTCNMQL